MKMPDQLSTPVFQFGTSRFLQAHADLFIHEASQAGEAAGPVTVLASSGSAAGRARLRPLTAEGGYPVIIRGIEEGTSIDREVRVKSIRRALDAEADWPRLSALFAEQAQFVVSNTTEAGLSAPPDLVVDLSRRQAAAPPGYPAKLLALLAERFDVSGRPVIVLPTELVPRNGDSLKAVVLDLARRSRASDALVSFIAEDCLFANSLVDRIVAAAIDPAGAVAEPYALWAIEEQPGLAPPCRHRAIACVPDLWRYEKLKLHILNLGHTVLAQCWLSDRLKPELTVREILRPGRYRDLLTEIYRAEVIPGFGAHGLEREAETYVATTLDRFDNPFLDHRLADIAIGHPTKVRNRIVGFLEGLPPVWRRQAVRLRKIASEVDNSSIDG